MSDGGLIPGRTPRVVSAARIGGAWIAAFASAAVLVSTLSAWVTDSPDQDVGSLESLHSSGRPERSGPLAVEGSEAGPRTRALAHVQTDASDGPVAATPTIPSIQVHSARLTDQRWQPRPVPTRLRIPAIGTDARVAPIGVDAPSGEMDVPVDVDLVGWYRFGATPGQPGSSVLVGHVDSRTQGAGVFIRLSQVQPGDRVIVDLGTGRSEDFRVVARRSYGKEDLPDLLFSRQGPPFLTLVTCGGAFDRSTRHYSDNVVVYAVPVDSGVDLPVP